jgi:hypothetical protein
MPFTPNPTFRDYAAGDLIYGWDRHRFWFTSSKKANKPRWMEDFDTPLTSANSDFGTDLKQGHQKYGAVVDKGSAYDLKDITQKCKGGLWWATQSVHKHVHFYLGGLDMAWVVEKKGGITCAELRWTFRFRSNTDVQTYIQFWRPAGCNVVADLKSADQKPGAGYEQCYPPWDNQFGDLIAEDTWKAYSPRGRYLINGANV